MLTNTQDCKDAAPKYVTVAAFTMPEIGYEVRLERFITAPYFRIKVYGGDPDAPAEWEFEGEIGHMSQTDALSRFIQALSENDSEIAGDIQSAQQRHAEKRGAL